MPLEEESETSMKASYFDEMGGPEVLKYGEVPDPVASSDQVIVDIHAASVNAADAKVRIGHYAPITEFPSILGRDFSGIVSAIGSEVTDLKVGDQVFGVCAAGQEGAYAEKIAVKASIVARKPNSLSHVEVAAVSLIGLTALVSIEDTLKLQSGEKILIQGGAGGVASFAIQIAKHIGAYVITTASASNHDYVRELGADEVIDYTTQDFTEVVSDCDALFETVGGDVATQSFSVLKPGGRAAFIASGGKAPESPRADVQSLRPAVGRDRPHLERIVELIQSGAIKLPKITEYHLRDAKEAQIVSESRHLRGKLVFKVR
jgi:NADPH:quinone reductase-like Zn-dependent oxidoreductase